MKQPEPNCGNCVHDAIGYTEPCKRAAEYKRKHKTMVGFRYCMWSYRGNMHHEYHRWDGSTK